MEELATQLGVGGIFSILLIREFANFANKRKMNGNGGSKYIEWERQKTMEEILSKLTDAINNQSQIMNSVVHNVKETREDIKEVVKEIRKK